MDRVEGRSPIWQSLCVEFVSAYRVVDNILHRSRIPTDRQTRKQSTLMMRSVEIGLAIRNNSFAGKHSHVLYYAQPLSLDHSDEALNFRSSKVVIEIPSTRIFAISLINAVVHQAALNHIARINDLITQNGHRSLVRPRHCSYSTPFIQSCEDVLVSAWHKLTIVFCSPVYAVSTLAMRFSLARACSSRPQWMPEKPGDGKKPKDKAKH